MTKKLQRLLNAMMISCDSQQLAVAECLTTIAENGDEQAEDAYLVDCAEEIRDAAQDVIDEMRPTPKNAKNVKNATFETDAHAALLELAKLIVARWGEAIENDEPISGCDAVDSLGCYVDLAKDALDMERTHRGGKEQ